MQQCVESICGKVSKERMLTEFVIFTNDIFKVGDGTRYYMRGCALRGRVSRKQGRDCIERVGMYTKTFNRGKILTRFLTGTWKTKMWYCQCDNKDGCNGSIKQQFSDIIMLFAISLLLWQWKFNL